MVSRETQVPADIHRMVTPKCSLCKTIQTWLHLWGKLALELRAVVPASAADRPQIHLDKNWVICSDLEISFPQGKKTELVCL